jgi:hypothetical protein
MTNPAPTAEERAQRALDGYVWPVDGANPLAKIEQEILAAEKVATIRALRRAQDAVDETEVPHSGLEARREAMTAIEAEIKKEEGQP